jgi:hypothetical protein
MWTSTICSAAASTSGSDLALLVSSAAASGQTNGRRATIAPLRKKFVDCLSDTSRMTSLALRQNHGVKK